MARAWSSVNGACDESANAVTHGCLPPLNAALRLKIIPFGNCGYRVFQILSNNFNLNYAPSEVKRHSDT